MEGEGTSEGIVAHPIEIAHRLEQVRERIADAGADPMDVRIVAVTKGCGPDIVRSIMKLGIVDLGESYAQELISKARITGGDPLLGDPGVPAWHFIGRLQSNKVKGLAQVVSVWQSIDRERLVHELARRAPGAQVFIEVNVSGEPGKGGCLPIDVGRLVGLARDCGLRVAGLMTIGPRGSERDVRSGFRMLNHLADTQGLAERSMGMSGDYEIAVQEGATIVRLGTALFGPRADPRKVQ